MRISWAIPLFVLVFGAVIVVGLLLTAHHAPVYHLLPHHFG